MNIKKLLFFLVFYNGGKASALGGQTEWAGNPRQVNTYWGIPAHDIHNQCYLMSVREGYFKLIWNSFPLSVRETTGLNYTIIMSWTGVCMYNACSLSPSTLVFGKNRQHVAAIVCRDLVDQAFPPNGHHHTIETLGLMWGLVYSLKKCNDVSRNKLLSTWEEVA